jgi:hypothetical protein
VQCVVNLRVHRTLGQQDVNPHVVRLAAAVQPPNGLLVEFQRPRQGQEHHVAAAELQVQTVAGRLRVRQQQFDLARVPAVDGLRLVQASRAWVAALQLGQLGLILVGDDRVGVLVLG